jgi:hypothetical protein
VHTYAIQVAAADQATKTNGNDSDHETQPVDKYGFGHQHHIWDCGTLVRSCASATSLVEHEADARILQFVAVLCILQLF